jgi:hypothetical protein
MPREVFRRPTSKLNDADLSASKPTGPRRELVEPGDYDVVIDQAHLVKGRDDPRNRSVALELRDLDSGKVIDTRPLWVAGPNADRGPMASHNWGIVADLLNEIGVAEQSYPTFTNPLLSQLVGKMFSLEIGIDRGRDGKKCNNVLRVNGRLADAADDGPDVLPFSSAAD